MNHAPKVGDKFKLGGWVFEVQEWNKDDRRFISYSDNGMRYLVLWKGDASSLDWIEEPVTATISQEAYETIDSLLLRVWESINNDQEPKLVLDRARQSIRSMVGKPQDFYSESFSQEEKDVLKNENIKMNVRLDFLAGKRAACEEILDWIPRCQGMYHDAYSNKDVEAVLTNFLKAKLNEIKK